ncbi:MAG: hypothetical protein JOS17DRAFT_795172 [Linnemannia elongata]|nr:MAG: hypothetical protein JOS17DRAFT_795172 [Linnemannia elongata]
MSISSSSSLAIEWPSLILAAVCICTLIQIAQLSPPELVQLDATSQVSGQHLMFASLAMVITSTMFGTSAAMTKKPGYAIMAVVTYFEYIVTIHHLFGLGFVSFLQIVLYSTALGSTGWEICQRELSLGREARHVVYYGCHGKAFWTDGRVTDGVIFL